jgi:hypothetical protein
MADTVLEKILANLQTALQGVTIDNDYDFDMAEVERFEAEGNSLENLPKSIIATLDQQKLVETTRTVEWEIEVWVQHHLVHDKATDTRSTDQVLIEHRSNLYKAVMADRTRGGHAVDCTVEKVEDYDLMTDEGRDCGVNLGLKIRFRHAVNDPWTAV